MNDYLNTNNKNDEVIQKYEDNLSSDFELEIVSDKSSDDDLLNHNNYINNTFIQNSINNNFLGFVSPYLEATLKKIKFNKQIDEQALRKKIHKNDIRNKICICLSNSRYDVVSRVSRQLGYKIVKESEQWNICWTEGMLGVEFYKDMRRFQKVNHFPGMFEICRKDLLARNLNRMLRMFPLDYQIFPKTWCFPADLGDAIAYSKLHRNKTFIIKPDQGAQGKGIWLTKNLKEIKPTDRMICQLYVNKPLLIDGFKFDLRVYVLITSTDPLRVYVYNEGLARFATSKYKEPNVCNTQNMFMHLTNYSVNKHSRTYTIDNEAGSKRKFSSINKKLADEGHNVEELWANIDDIIVKTILSAYPMLKHNYSACFPSHDIIQACFEILGIDILIDNKLKPYILEVNHSPSFHTNEPIDLEVKCALIKDAFNMLHISTNDKKLVLEEDKKRVKNRLLQKISKDSQPTSTDCIQSPSKIWSAQINWEEAHLGGYRRIMPPVHGDITKYSPFFILQSQASVYGDTAASKRREECTKQQRKVLAEKINLQQQLTKRIVKLKPIYEGGGGRDERPKSFRRRRKSAVTKQIKNFTADEINDLTERKRNHLMAQRDFLVRSCGLIQDIIASFHQNNLLAISDKKKYKDIYNKIIENDDRLHVLNPLVHYTLDEQDKNRKPHSMYNTSTMSFGINCKEAPINVLPPLPSNINYRSTKAAQARQLSNTVKIQNIESRETWFHKETTNNI